MFMYVILFGRAMQLRWTAGHAWYPGTVVFQSGVKWPVDLLANEIVS